MREILIVQAPPTHFCQDIFDLEGTFEINIGILTCGFSNLFEVPSNPGDGVSLVVVKT